MHCTFCGVNLDSLHGVLGYEKMSKEFGLVFNNITHEDIDIRKTIKL